MSSKYFAIILSGIILLGSCRKQEKPHNTSDGIVKIIFNESYLDNAKTDSAVGMWKTATKTQQFIFHPSPGGLQISIDSLQEGSGTFTVQLFTRTKVDTLNLQWEKQWDVTLQHGKTIELTAPASLEDPNWYPRIIFKDGRLDLFAFISLRPHDPYFELRSKDPKWAGLTVTRNYYDNLNGNLIGGGTWLCTASCYDGQGKVIDRGHFSFLSTIVGSIVCKGIEIHVRFSESWAMNRNFHFSYQFS